MLLQNMYIICIYIDLRSTRKGVPLLSNCRHIGPVSLRYGTRNRTDAVGSSVRGKSLIPFYRQARLTCCSSMVEDLYILCLLHFS